MADKVIEAQNRETRHLPWARTTCGSTMCYEKGDLMADGELSDDDETSLWCLTRIWKRCIDEPNDIIKVHGANFEGVLDAISNHIWFG